MAEKTDHFVVLNMDGHMIASHESLHDTFDWIQRNGPPPEGEQYYLFVQVGHVVNLMKKGHPLH